MVSASTSKTLNRKVGAEAESLTCTYLINKGYVLRKANHQTKLGEIDLIMNFDRTVVFVEVKSRKSQAWGDPFEAVNKTKQGKIIKVAIQYIIENKIKGMDFRFDVVSVVFRDHEEPQIDHYPAAFDASGSPYLF